MHAKGNSGKHLSVIPSFCYKKDPNDKQRWLIDEEAANTVRKIFNLYINGNGLGAIARILTEQGVETPKLYSERLSLKHYKQTTYTEIWNRNSVEYIVDNYEYTGCTVNFKTKRKSFKNKKQWIQGKDDWAIFENTQEAIIDKATFETVREMRKSKRAYTKFNEVNIFSGLLYCEKCGQRMTIRRVAKDRRRDEFVCSTYRKKKKGLCSQHSIRKSVLERIVLNDIQRVSNYVFLHDKEFEELFRKNSVKETAKIKASSETNLKKIDKRLEEIKKIIFNLYEDKYNGKLGDERFDFLVGNYEEEQKQLLQQKTELNEKVDTICSEEKNMKSFMAIAKSYIDITELTAEILNSFIDKIYITEPEVYCGQRMQSVKIVYKLVGAIDLPQNILV